MTLDPRSPLSPGSPTDDEDELFTLLVPSFITTKGLFSTKEEVKPGFPAEADAFLVLEGETAEEGKEEEEEESPPLSGASTTLVRLSKMRLVEVVSDDDDGEFSSSSSSPINLGSMSPNIALTSSSPVLG